MISGKRTGVVLLSVLMLFPLADAVPVSAHDDFENQPLGSTAQGWSTSSLLGQPLGAATVTGGKAADGTQKSLLFERTALGQDLDLNGGLASCCTVSAYKTYSNDSGTFSYASFWVAAGSNTADTQFALADNQSTTFVSAYLSPSRFGCSGGAVILGTGHYCVDFAAFTHVELRNVSFANATYEAYVNGQPVYNGYGKPIPLQSFDNTNSLGFSQFTITKSVSTQDFDDGPVWFDEFVTY